MGNLIAIIFSIVLGAAATALTLVYLGSGFSDKSADIKAQQFIQAASQVESAMTIYKAEHANTAFDTKYSTTVNKLGNLIKETPIAGQGEFSMAVDDSNENTPNPVWMIEGNHQTNTQKVVTEEVCKALADDAAIIDMANVVPNPTELTAMKERFACFKQIDKEVYALAYRVE